MSQNTERSPVTNLVSRTSSMRSQFIEAVRTHEVQQNETRRPRTGSIANIGQLRDLSRAMMDQREEEADDSTMMALLLQNVAERSCGTGQRLPGLLPWGTAAVATSSSQFGSSRNVLRSMSYGKRVQSTKKRFRLLAALFITLTCASAIVYAFRKDLGTFQDVKLWRTLTGIFFVVAAIPISTWICEGSFVLLRRFVTRPWQLLIVFDAIERPLPIFIVAIAVRSSFHPWLQPEADFPNFEAFLDSILALIVLWTLFIRIGCQTVLRKFHRNSFSNSLDEIFVLEDVANILCCPAERRQDVWRSLRDWRFKQNYRTRLDRINGPLMLPLKRINGTRPPQFTYSTEFAVEINDEESLTAMADHVFLALSGEDAGKPAKPFGADKWNALFPDYDTAFVARTLFLDPIRVRLDENEAIEPDDIPAALVEMFRRRNAVRSQVDSWNNLTNVLMTLARFTFLLVLIFVVAFIFGANLNAVLVTFTSLTVAFAFAFASPVSKMVEGVLFIFGTKPFLIGDRVEIDGSVLFVSEVNLLTTTFTTLDKRCLIYPNKDLANKPFINSRRTKSAVLKLEFEILFSSSWSKLQKLRASVAQYLEARPRVWVPGVGMYACDSKKTNILEISFWVETRTSWQNGGAVYATKSALHRFIRCRIIELGLEWRPAVAAVKFQQNSENIGLSVIPQSPSKQDGASPVSFTASNQTKPLQ